MQLNQKYTYNPATDLIGKGGFGRVYKAWDADLGEYVALKRVSAADIPEGYDLIKEVLRARRFSHPNLCTYYDGFRFKGADTFGEEQEFHFAVMELITGGQIDQIGFAKLPDATKLDLLRQILEGLAYLHGEGVIHRDIKPSNILIQKSEDKLRVKITDFGISKHIAADYSLVSNAIGSIEYMPPEQFQEGEKISYNADIWSFGVLLYELITEELPFGSRKENNSKGVIIDAIHKRDVSAKLDNIAEPYRSLIKACLVKDRNQRVKDLAALRELISHAKPSVNKESLQTTGSNQEEEKKTIAETYPEQAENGSPKMKTWIYLMFILAAVTVLMIVMFVFKINEASFRNYTETAAGLDIEMIFVRGGTSYMGCNQNSIDDCYGEELPYHEVEVNNFYIGKFEITQKQWYNIMGSNPSTIKDCSGCPVVNVSWYDAQLFISKLNLKSGKNYRLPTEAEWEYAARGGRFSNDYIFAGNGSINDVAWYKENSANRPQPVGQKVQNELGLYDMSGNVYEWCSDWFGNYGSNTLLNPQGPTTGNEKVLRGGSWYDVPRDCRVYYRFKYNPDHRGFNIGFRLVREPG
jgi:formylglycine-generating enzyme required for sulfatase activity